MCLFYDEIGNLIADKSENITNIVWSIYGKVLQVEKQAAAKTTIIDYVYDATGNRVKKELKVYFTTDPSMVTKSSLSYYFRDAQGNVLNTLSTSTTTELNGATQLKNTCEFVLYGSSRLGTYSPEQLLSSPSLSGQFFGIANYSLTLGYKAYELSNHLGNVLTTISDNVIITPPSGVGGLSARVLSSQDYYPFGRSEERRVGKEC